MTELNLTVEVQERLRKFLHSDVDKNERGCLLSKTGELVPIENKSLHPRVEILQGEDSFISMVQLLETGNLEAWVHSHPQWRAFPSPKDVDNHNVPCDMIIYSCIDRVFCRYTYNDLQRIKQFYKEQRGNTSCLTCKKKQGRSTCKTSQLSEPAA